MPVDLGPSFALDFAGRPAHMSAVDWVLWNRFRHSTAFSFVRLYFDVAVGPGADAGINVSENVRAAWARITKQRIDVVGERAEGWTIIELRGAAGPGAIGSLMVYRQLWNVAPPDPRPVSLLLVTDVFADALRPTLEAAGISLFLV